MSKPFALAIAVSSAGMIPTRNASPGTRTQCRGGCNWMFGRMSRRLGRKPLEHVAPRSALRKIGRHQQILEREQLAQRTDRLPDVVIVAHSLQSTIDVAPCRWAAALQSFLDEGASVIERGDASWLRRVLDQKRRFDAKVVHEAPS